MPDHRANLPSILTAFLAVSILTLGCSLTGRLLDNPDGSPPGASSEAETDPACGPDGEPCSYADFEGEILNQSTEALDQAALVLDESGSVAEAARTLEERSDLAMLRSSPEGLVFRLKGGPEMWLINGAAIKVGTKSFGSPGGSGAPAPDHPLPHAPGWFRADDGPIGESEQGEEPTKKALILSPFWWEFGDDETDDLAQLLGRAHRNYRCEGCVELKINTIRQREEGESREYYELAKTLSMDYGVSLTDFASWGKYDLVHVSTHGMQICDDQGCSTMIMTGRFLDKPEWTEAGSADFDVPGVHWGRTAVPGCGGLDQQLESGELSDEAWERTYQEWKGKGCSTYTNRWWQVLGPGFFSSVYGGADNSLDEKFIFFSACQSMKDLTLSQAVAGNNTTVLGWTETVDADAAAKVSMDFYELYIRQGLRAEVAFKEVKDNLGENFQADALRRFKPKGIEIEALVPPEFEQEGEENTRGREIITLFQPIYREELKERDPIPTNGIPGDGENDELLFHIQIDGIDEDQDPEEFSIHLAVNGEELEETFQLQEKTGDYSYKVVDFAELPFDTAGKDFVELEAWVDLPNGGQSRHVLEEVELANCGWSGTMSGSRSGSVEGDIVLPTDHLASVNLEDFLSLAEPDALGGFGEGSSSLPTPEELSGMPFGVFLGSRAQYPTFILIDGSGATGVFSRTELTAGQQSSLNLSPNTAEKKEGSFSAPMTELKNQSQFSLQGDMYWHVESLCSLNVILELARNPLPASLGQ
jgi:hypothetical protein